MDIVLPKPVEYRYGETSIDTLNQSLSPEMFQSNLNAISTEMERRNGNLGYIAGTWLRSLYEEFSALSTSHAPQPMTSNLPDNLLWQSYFQYVGGTTQAIHDFVQPKLDRLNEWSEYYLDVGAFCNWLDNTIGTDPNQNIMDANHVGDAAWEYMASAGNAAWEDLEYIYYNTLLYINGIDVEAAIVDRSEDILDNPAYTDMIKHAIHRKIKEEQYIQNQINEQYDLLYSKIKTALEKSIKNKKPLMILIGEEHSSLHSAQAESIVIHICNELFGLNTILMEAFHKKDYNAGIQYSCLPLATVEDLCFDLRIKKIPIDLAMCAFRGQENFEGCESSNPLKPEIDIRIFEEMQYRNQVMADVAIKLNVKNTVTIVGASHLIGLMEETALHAHNEILPINTAEPIMFPENMFAGKQILYAFTKSKVEQVAIPLLYGKHSKSPDFLIKQIKHRSEKAHGRQKVARKDNSWGAWLYSMMPGLSPYINGGMAANEPSNESEKKPVMNLEK